MAAVLTVALVSSAPYALKTEQARAWLPPEGDKELGCTVVEPTHKITLEVTIPDSFEYCPMLARALSEDVLHRRVGIVMAHWHYPGSTLSCRLHQRPPDTKRRIAIHNSHRACRWLVLSGWLSDASSRQGSPLFGPAA